jgi:PIN domain nuclease of toxin-antitoxin system
VRLLLDTQVVIWFLASSARIGADVRATLVDRRNAVFVSVVTGWEMATKSGLGHVQVPPDLRFWLPGELEASGFVVLPISLDHALAVETLPLHHRDPFDRLLIAQARVEDMTLVTADQWFSQYDVRLLRV